MNRKSVLTIVLVVALVVAVGAWALMGGTADPSKPTANVPAGPDATAKATEEGDQPLPPLKK